MAPAGDGARRDKEAKPKRRGTADNKIYPLRSEDREPEPRRGPTRQKIADKAQGVALPPVCGQLALTRRSDHIDGA